MDKPEDNKAFKEAQGYPFPLLCDVDRKVSVAYGAVADEKAFVANRISYLIDENGMIQKSFDKVNPSTHPQEVLQILTDAPSQ